MLIALVIVLAIFLAFMLLKNVLKQDKKPVTVAVRDECSLVLGNIIHPIKDKDGCGVKCVNECRSRELRVLDVVFEEKTTECHSCMCFCA